MSEDASTDATVLVVEDERHLADHYAECLADRCTVVTAYGGEEGVERLTDDVDVALVERRMAMVSGTEVLAAIEERDLECQVAFLADAPPEDAEIAAGVDDYLVRPVDCEEIEDVVDRLLAIATYRDLLQELTTKKLERNVQAVEAESAEGEDEDDGDDDHDGDGTVEGDDGTVKGETELDREIQRLEERVDELERELDVDEDDIDL